MASSRATYEEPSSRSRLCMIGIIIFGVSMPFVPLLVNLHTVSFHSPLFLVVALILVPTFLLLIIFSVTRCCETCTPVLERCGAARGRKRARSEEEQTQPLKTAFASANQIYPSTT